MVTAVNLLHLWESAFPLHLTEFLILIDVELLQPSKAPYPILVTEFGIVIDVKPVQL